MIKKMKTKPLIFLLSLTFLFLFSGSSVVFADDPSWDMLQRGHKMKHEGNLDAAIEFYRKSLEIKKNSFAENSLKTALSLKQLDQFKANINSACQESNNDTSIQESCLKEYFFFGGNPIHPKIIKEFQIWILDRRDQVVSINLVGSQGSNRYCCISDIDISSSESRQMIVRVNLEEGGWFAYMFYGTSKNGILVVRTFESGGGSGVFSSLLLLKTKVIFKLKNEGNKISKSKKRRIYLEKLYSIGLGDREEHKIAIDGDLLVIDGNRVDISSL